MRTKTALITFLFIFLGINVIVLDLFTVFSKTKQKPGSSPSSVGESEINSPTLSPQTQDFCPASCRQEFQEILDASQKNTEDIRPTPSIARPTPTPILFSPLAKALYIPLISSASTTDMNWVDITPSEFYFDLSDYPGVKSVRLEAYLMALHGSGAVFVRLYDFSNKRGVDFSEISAQSNNFSLLTSSPMTIWRGNNLYRIQMKSINGTEAFLRDARLKILF